MADINGTCDERFEAVRDALEGNVLRTGRQPLQAPDGKCEACRTGGARRAVRLAAGATHRIQHA